MKQKNSMKKEFSERWKNTKNIILAKTIMNYLFSTLYLRRVLRPVLKILWGQEFHIAFCMKYFSIRKKMEDTSYGVLMGRNFWKIFIGIISFGKHPAITLMPGRIILWALRACGKTSSFLCCQWQSERWKKEMCCGIALFLILFLLVFLILNFINVYIVVWSFVRDV